jgi:hypothetical protein
MMYDVFEKTIHCMQRADSPPAMRRRALRQAAPQKAAEYSSRPVSDMPRGLRRIS